MLSKTGYDAVQICLLPGWPTDPSALDKAAQRELGTQLRDSGLALASVMDSLPLSGLPAKRTYNLERIRLAAELAHAIAPAAKPVLDTVLGLRPSGWESEKGRITDDLSQWAETAKQAGIVIGIKPHVEQAVNSAERALYLMNQLKSPQIRLIYDYSHMQLAGLTLADSLRQLLPYTASISVKDAAGTAEKHDFLLPGEGSTDYAQYFGLLKSLQYRGFVNVEVSALIHRRPAYDPTAAVQICYARLAQKMRRAGLR